MVNTPKKIDHPEPNLYKEPRNQKFLAPLFFSCESSGESVSLSFCLALAAFSDPGAGRGGRDASVGFIMFCFMSLKEISPTTSPAHPRAQWRLRELSRKTG